MLSQVRSDLMLKAEDQYTRPKCKTTHRLNVKLVSTGQLSAPSFGERNTYVAANLRQHGENLDEHEQRQSVKVLDQRTPIWDPVHDYGEWHIDFVKGQKTSMFLEVMDWNRFWDDESVGFANIDLDEFMEAGHQRKAFDLLSTVTGSFMTQITIEIYLMSQELYEDSIVEKVLVGTGLVQKLVG